MKVILEKDVDALGTSGDIVDVKDGYARNYLLPKHFAREATKGALKDLNIRIERIKAKVEKKNGLIVSTWKPHPRLASVTGDILISRKGKLLHGVVFMNAAGEIVSKQFFRKYDLSKGLPFPTELIQVLYRGKQENYRVTSFRNIQFNAQDTDGYYTYSIGS